MIKISMGEGTAYDILSITEVKHKKNLENNKARYIFLKRLSELSDLIGADKHLQVLRSKEYSELYNLNLRIYEIIDGLKSVNKDKCYDEIIDKMNHERSKLAANIQKEYFSGSDSWEQKFGYEHNK